ncbi:MAG: peptidase E [Bifidobacteriaceae bacterium]|jgi:dipeptidase E|nr:peptidase E [Bifidobacteriaceae bacterium]
MTELIENKLIDFNLINRKLKICAIGGGEIAIKDNKISDGLILIKYALKQFSLKENSKVLIIPTAKSSQKQYNQMIESTYQAWQNLGLKIDLLHQYNKMPAVKKLKEKIERADCFYITGGDTLQMMTIWRKYKIDKLLSQSANKGKAILGVSAGAIAPMIWGHSDSMSYKVEAGHAWDYIKVEGLGLLPLAITPHYDTKMPPKNKPRAKEFKKMYLTQAKSKPHNIITGFGINNFAAIIVQNGKLDFASTRPTAHIHKLFIRGGQVATQTMPNKLLYN